jgi:hypothetical protein
MHNGIISTLATVTMGAAAFMASPALALPIGSGQAGFQSTFTDLTGPGANGVDVGDTVSISFDSLSFGNGTLAGLGITGTLVVVVGGGVTSTPTFQITGFDGNATMAAVSIVQNVLSSAIAGTMQFDL